MTAERVIQLVAAASRVLKETPLRHERERVYHILWMTLRQGCSSAIAEATVNEVRVVFKDLEFVGIVECPHCGQKNRINLRSPHDDDIGPRCGRCKQEL